MAKRAFGELELAILQLFKSGKRLTVKEVHRLLKEENSYNTIMTVMNRLASKKQLAREKTGLQYTYWLISPTEKIPTLVDQFKKRVFGIKTSEIVSFLIESGENISDEELDEMKRMIEKAKEQRS